MLLDFDLMVLLVVSLVGVLLAFGIGLLCGKSSRRRPRRAANQARMITATIIDYFARSGVEVNVGCITLDGSRRYTVVIESEPMKRFRLSHIVEATLTEYVLQTCKLEIEKIYWRFPVREESPQYAASIEAAKHADLALAAGVPEVHAASVDPAKPEEAVDDYINEGLVLHQHLQQMEVTELSWEKFQEVSALEAKKKLQQDHEHAA